MLGLLLLLGGCIEPPPQHSESIGDALDDTALEHAAKHMDTKYVCPMHPQIVRDEPGATCPICGMDLVPKQIDVRAGKYPVVEVGNAVVNSMGVRSEPAQIETLWKYIETVGRIAYDETRLAHVHPRASGWMEQLALRAEGDPVERGQVIGRLYSEEILSAQVDYLIALDQSSGKRSVEKARNRLRLLGVPEGTISAIQKRRETINTVPILSNASGVVTMLGARRGMYVTPDSEIVTIADLSRIWVLVDVYEHQIDWLAEGLSAEIKVPAYPGRAWEGSVEYIYPALDPKSRTLKVRLAFDNPDGLLKANMFADVVIYRRGCHRDGPAGECGTGARRRPLSAGRRSHRDAGWWTGRDPSRHQRRRPRGDIGTVPDRLGVEPAGQLPAHGRNGAAGRHRGTPDRQPRVRRRRR